MASTIAAITTGTGGVVTTADSSGDLSLLSGATTVVAVTSTGVAVTGLVDISAATSGQIQFPATQNASANANTLDDYEEGTWSPQVYYQNAANQSAAVNTIQTGTYTKIGNAVTLQWSLTFTAPASPAVDNIGVKNLPFTSAIGITCPFHISGSASLVANGGYVYTIGANTTLGNILSCTDVGNLGAAIGGGSRTFVGGCTFKIV